MGAQVTAARRSFFLVRIDAENDDIPLVVTDSEAEGSSYCAGLNRIGYHVYSYVNFQGSSISIGEKRLHGDDIVGGVAQFEIQADELTTTSLLVPLLLSSSGSVEVNDVAVTQDKLAMVGTFHGAMGNDIVDATSDTSHTFVVMGDHHYRSECAIRVMENTDDREDMIGRLVHMLESGLIAVGGSETAVISDDITSSMQSIDIQFVSFFELDSHKRLKETNHLRLRVSSLDSLNGLWGRSDIVISGTFSGRFGIQAPDHVHHFVYPITAEGDSDGYMAALGTTSHHPFGVKWITSVGYPSTSVLQLMSTTSQVHHTSSVTSILHSQEVVVSGVFSGDRIAAGENEAAAQQFQTADGEQEVPVSTFTARADETGKWLALTVLEDYSGWAQIPTAMAMNNVEARAYLAVSAGDALFAWVGEVTPLVRPSVADAGISSGDVGSTETTEGSSSSGLSLGALVLFILIPVVIIAALGSALALVIYLVRRPDVGPEYSMLELG